MSVFIVGHKGNMGRRYAAILKYLGIPSWGRDVEASNDQIFQDAKVADHIIIATPTETHLPLLKMLGPIGHPILCEKPISKDVKRLRDDLEFLEKHRANITMVSQYQELNPSRGNGDTYYNYFKHGTDGIFWDCIQMIALARGDLSLGEDSPIWTCVLNGKKISLADMDQAYVSFIQKWLNEPGQDLSALYRLHVKVALLEQEHGNDAGLH